MAQFARSVAVFVALVFVNVLPTRAGDPLQFKQTEFDIAREGYVTLSWNEPPGAAEYRLTAGDGQSVYRGPLSEAFVSDLNRHLPVPSGCTG